MTNSRTIIGIIIIIIGFSLLFDIPIFRFVIPAFLIIIGVRVLTGKSFGMFENFEEKGTREDEIKRVLIFSGIKQKIVSNNFKKAEIVAVFGGGEIDLSGAKSKQKEVNMEFTTIFGGLKVIVPSDWSVKTEGVGILGAFNNNTATGSGKKTNQALVKGVAIFGGVELAS